MWLNEYDFHSTEDLGLVRCLRVEASRADKIRAQDLVIAICVSILQGGSIGYQHATSLGGDATMSLTLLPPPSMLL